MLSQVFGPVTQLAVVAHHHVGVLVPQQLSDLRDPGARLQQVGGDRVVVEIRDQVATRKVAVFVIARLLKLQQRYDLRLFVRCYQQWKDGETESDWRSLVGVSIEYHLSTVRHPVESTSREDRKLEAHSVIREILLEHGTRELVWCRCTGRSMETFFRRLAEIQ